MQTLPAFYEFFAGGGMARAGLGAGWQAQFANDIDPAKAACYQANWGRDDFKLGDIADLITDDLPGQADLAWASFPCQDLSLAGGRRGLAGARSGMFWAFWRLVEGLEREGRGPDLIAIENVTGLLTSDQGRDFAALGDAIANAGYAFTAFIIDAAQFLPQSRPRLFVIASRNGFPVAETPAFHPPALQRAVANLTGSAKDAWLNVYLPSPPVRNTELFSVIEPDSKDIRWRSGADTKALLALMAPLHRARVKSAMKAGGRHIGTAFRRMRRDPSGQNIQRAEVRFDGLAGCLRTPAGGSSRQTLIIVEDGNVRTRLLSPREALRLMGLPDDYVAPPSLNAALKLTGDGVAVPVVRHLAEHLFEPHLAARSRAAA